MHVPSLSFSFSFLYIYLLIYLFFCFGLIFKLNSFILARITRKLTTLPQTRANKILRVRLDWALYYSFFLMFRKDFSWATFHLSSCWLILQTYLHIDMRNIKWQVRCGLRVDISYRRIKVEEGEYSKLPINFLIESYFLFSCLVW